jgi:hypothetical protein
MQQVSQQYGSTSISALKPNMKNLTIQAIVLQTMENGEPRHTRDGHDIYSFLIADPCGSIELLLWDELGRYLTSGSIVVLTSAYTMVFRDSMKLYISKVGRVKRIGEFTMVFSETPNMSVIKWVPDTDTPSHFIASVEPSTFPLDFLSVDKKEHSFSQTAGTKRSRNNEE